MIFKKQFNQLLEKLDQYTGHRRMSNIIGIPIYSFSVMTLNAGAYLLNAFCTHLVVVEFDSSYVGYDDQTNDLFYKFLLGSVVGSLYALPFVFFLPIDNQVEANMNPRLHLPAPDPSTVIRKQRLSNWIGMETAMFLVPIGQYLGRQTVGYFESSDHSMLFDFCTSAFCARVFFFFPWLISEGRHLAKDMPALELEPEQAVGHRLMEHQKILSENKNLKKSVEIQQTLFRLGLTLQDLEVLLPDDVYLSFYCPISFRFMLDPVILGTTGSTFDRGSILECLSIKPDINPLTNESLDAGDLKLIDNRTLRQAIIENIERASFIQKIKHKKHKKRH